MLNDIYNSRILDLAGNIPRLGRLAEPGATSRQHSRLCGSTVTVDLVMTGGVVSDYAQDVKACALGQAAAAIVARHVIGATADELRDVRDRVRAMLKAGGAPPEGPWAEAGVLQPVRDYKVRHASTMLAFEAAAQAATQIEAASPAMIGPQPDRNLRPPGRPDTAPQLQEPDRQPDRRARGALP